jgi:hypothetical protein
MNEEQVSEAASSRRPLWTIMVYIAGDNNLSANSISILQELEDASRNCDVRVLAGYDSSAPFHKGARYLEIQHRRYQAQYGMNWGLHNDMVYPDGHLVGSPDFCSGRRATIRKPTEPTARAALARFLKWAVKKHRAERHMLILFGHGILVAGNTFLSDTTPPSFLRLNDFEKIIKDYFGPTCANKTDDAKPHLDILACDNCVMNSVEAAYTLRDVTDYIIGSQDLMLAVGWPFRKIVQAVQREPRASTKTISRRFLKACARRLLDYSLMERSSDQAVCSLVKLRDHKLFNGIKDLAHALKRGLEMDEQYKPKHPEIVDAVRLARLEAQAYWDETFVDLYDFCELLLQRCGNSFSQQLERFKAASVKFENTDTSAVSAEATNTNAPTNTEQRDRDLRNWFLESSVGSLWDEIHRACLAILAEFTITEPEQGIIPYSYYVCPNLQYSHGLSIYFPWTLPEDAIRYKPVRGAGGQETEDYELITAFEEYEGYDFASPDVTDWACFLEQFFRATLRNVRMKDQSYKTSQADFRLYKEDYTREEPTLPINLQKSSPDTGEQDDLPRPRIKNYPRRFYLSPEDCHNKCQEPGIDAQPQELPDQQSDTKCVPYLGWQIKGLLADLIRWPTEGDDGQDDNTH